MDLTIPFGAVTLNIRVHIVLQTTSGFLFFQSKSGHYAMVGGRVKASESSLAAARRELEEETGLQMAEEKFKLISVIENFYDGHNKDRDNEITKFQEIGFVYLLTEKIDTSKLDSKFIQEFSLIEFSMEEMKEKNILPSPAKTLILENKLNDISHFII
jgi:8-oxo-dGTP pyrophosphatase MutT (NUDIX family)